MLRYVAKSLRRNPRRALAAVAGVSLAFALFADAALFVDGSGHQMTRRSIAHVTIDMQAAVNEPLASSLSLSASVAPRPPVAPGAAVTVTMVAANSGSAPANEVVLEAPTPPQVAYVAGSTQRDGAPVPDLAPTEETPASASPLPTGLNLGALAPGARVTITYRAAAVVPVASAADLVTGTLRSAENPTPAVANGPKAVDLGAAAAAIRGVPNVRAAQPFGLVDLPPGALTVGGARLDAPVTLIGLDPSYSSEIPIVGFPGGDYRAGTAFLSPAAAQLLAAAPGANVQVSLPGAPAGPTLSLPLSAVADLTAADQLFASRAEDSRGDFVGAPYVVGVDAGTLQRQVLPALRADAASPVPVVKSPPVLEVHTQIDRQALSSDPAPAFRTTSAVRRSIEQLATGDLTVIDNVSASLSRARTDSTLAKILFIALGLPGVFLAGYLAFYGGGLLAESERRERALLRARGFTPVTLTRGVAYQSLAIAVLGSLVGSAVALAGASLLFASEVSPGSDGFAVSMALAAAVSLVTTLLAVYLPARRALLRDVTEDRQIIQDAERPGWLRLRLDLVLLLVATVVSVVFVVTGGFKPNPKAHDESIARSFYVLLAPWCFWLGTALLVARGFLALSRRMTGTARVQEFRKHLVRRTVVRSIARRPRIVTAGLVTVSLAVAFGVSVASFVTTFRDEQRADARFVVGSDLRVTPSLGATAPADIEQRLRVPGVRALTPVAQSDAVVGTEKLLVAAVDARQFARVAPLSDGFFTDTTARGAMAALARDPQAALIDKETADTFNAHKGDKIKVQLPSPALGQPATVSFNVVGTLVQFPGFPVGLDLVANLATYQQETGTTAPSFYLLRTDGTAAVNGRAGVAVRDSLGPAIPAKVETTAKTANRDQTSLAGLSLTGLGDVESAYMVLIASLATIIFVAALLLQRGTERAVMRALGLARRRLRAMILTEAALVAIVSAVVGTVIGVPMAYMFVQILRRVFIVPPASVSMPPSGAVVLGALVVGTIAIAAVIISAAIRRVKMVELLRAE